MRISGINKSPLIGVNMRICMHMEPRIIGKQDLRATSDNTAYLASVNASAKISLQETSDMPETLSSIFWRPKTKLYMFQNNYLPYESKYILSNQKQHPLF